MLDTDATDHEAVFSQFQDGVENPTAFAIRTLSKSQKNYCVTRRELLVIVEFDKQHRHFLQSTGFCIGTHPALCPSLSWPKFPRDSLHVGLNS